MSIRVSVNVSMCACVYLPVQKLNKDPTFPAGDFDP